MWFQLIVIVGAVVFCGQVMLYHMNGTAALLLQLSGLQSELRSMQLQLAECRHGYRRLQESRADDRARQLLDCQLARDQLRHQTEHRLLARELDAAHRQLVMLDPAARRPYRRLVYVIPFITDHVPRLQELFTVHWAKHRPCDPDNPLYASYTDLVLYANRVLGASDQDHHRLVAGLLDSLARHRLDTCFGSVSVQVANFSATHDPETYQRKPIADQFFNVFNREVDLARYQYLAYMEPDTMPIRPLWLDRLYEQVEYGGDFWIKGSMYRGPALPLEFCYSACGCAEHMNGNAVYALHADQLTNFLNSVHRKMDFVSYNFDAFIMNQLKATENWRFWQANAHRFQYTEFLQHGQHYMHVNDIRDKYPDTYLVHQAKWD